MNVRHTLFHWLLEWIAGLLVVATVVGFLVCLPDLPERVPIHFGDSGQPDGWGTAADLWILLAVDVAAYVLMTVIAFLPHTWNIGGKAGGAVRPLRLFSVRTVSLPVRGVDPAFLPRVYRMTLTLLLVMKIVVLLTFGGLIFWGCIGGNALPQWAEPVLLAALLGPVLVYLFRVLVIKR